MCEFVFVLIVTEVNVCSFYGFAPYVCVCILIGNGTSNLFIENEETIKKKIHCNYKKDPTTTAFQLFILWTHALY